MAIYVKKLVLIIFLLISINVFAQDKFDWTNDFVRYYSYEYDLGKYHIMQYRANIRKEPTRNSDIVAILSFHDEIEILENSMISERINNVNSFWYKIKFGNIIGYAFGGNIAIETFITDIDKNGINDYFYYRYSRGTPKLFDPHKDDLIIYINNQRINTTVIKTAKAYTDNTYDSLSFCKFTEGDGYVVIELETWGSDHNGGIAYYFKVTSDGKIEYIGNARTGEWYW